MGGCNYSKATKLHTNCSVRLLLLAPANSSHSRLTKLLIRESNLLQGFSKHRLHAILVTFVFTRPKILCNLCQLMLEMKFPFLFNICFPHSLRSSSIADPLLGLAAELPLS